MADSALVFPLPVNVRYTYAKAYSQLLYTVHAIYPAFVLSGPVSFDTNHSPHSKKSSLQWEIEFRQVP